MKKTLITIGLTTLVIAALLGAAFFFLTNSFMGGAAVSNVYSTRNSGLSPMEMPASAPASAEFFVSDSGGGVDYAYNESVIASNVASSERLVIQNVDMSIVVTDPKAHMTEIAALAVKMGGFVVSSNLYQSSYGPNAIDVPEGNITVRVPSQGLDEALDSIKTGAIDITYENRSGQDVTSQYVDLQSRLSVKQNAEKKLLEIMDKAVTSEDVLAIYLQVQNVQTEIEVLKGQIKYYDESVALSAVSIHLVAEETVKPIEIGGWKLPETASNSVQDLIRFTQGFTQFLVRFFLNYLWRIVLIMLPLYGIFIGGRMLFRKFRKPQFVAEAKEEKKKK